MSSLESLLSQLDEAVKTKQAGSGERAVGTAQTQQESDRDAKERAAALDAFLGSRNSSAPPAAAKVESADTAGTRVALEQFLGSSIDACVTQAPVAQMPIAQTVREDITKPSARPEPPSAPIVDPKETCAYCGRDPVSNNILSAPSTAGTRTTVEVSEAPQCERVQAPHFTWKAHLSAAESAFNAGKHETAEAILKLLNDVAQILSIEIPVRMRLVTQLANIYILKGKPAEACEILSQMLELVEKTEFKKDIATAFCLDLQAQCFEMQARTVDAERCFRAAKEIAKEALGREHSGTDFFRKRLASFADKHDIENVTFDGTVPLEAILASAKAQESSAEVLEQLTVHEAKPSEAGDVQVEPPAKGEDAGSNAQAFPAIELAAPANELAAPANELAAPAIELAAPANELAAPVIELAAPVVELDAPADQAVVSDQDKAPAKAPADDKTLFDSLLEQRQLGIGINENSAQNVVPDAVAEVMFEKFLTQARNVLKWGNHKEAESYLSSAMQKAVAIADGDERKCEAYLLMASIMEKQEQLEDAQQVLETCLTNAFGARRDIQIGHCLKALAQVHGKLANMSQAKRYYKQSLLVYSSALGADHATTSQLQKEYEQFLLCMEDERKWQGLPD